MPSKERSLVGVHVSRDSVNAKKGDIRIPRFQPSDSYVIFGVAAVIDSKVFCLHKHAHCIWDFPTGNTCHMARRRGFNPQVLDFMNLAMFKTDDLIASHAPTQGVRRGARRHNETRIRIVSRDDRDGTGIEVILVPMGGDYRVCPNILW